MKRKILYNDKEYPVQLEVQDLGNLCKIILINEDIDFDILEEKEISVTGEYPFFVLMELRDILEKRKVYLLCNGSRYDVYPSNMSKIGYKAYITKIGKPSLEKDLVNIFDECIDRNYISTVQRQKEYNKKWMDFFRCGYVSE